MGISNNLYDTHCNVRVPACLWKAKSSPGGVRTCCHVGHKNSMFELSDAGKLTKSKGSTKKIRRHFTTNILSKNNFFEGQFSKCNGNFVVTNVADHGAIEMKDTKVIRMVDGEPKPYIRNVDNEPKVIKKTALEVSQYSETT
uniref:Uncharacterized protein n=1 Tax=Lactuca sativa TaxID=4236 RepID=A0A9R1VKR8_LACSA|nr:hypothetical protein LSAT_V11C400214330 [Lactuca sativa]